MKTRCPSCNAAYEIEDQYAGELVKCEKCKEEFYAMREDAKPKNQYPTDEKNVNKKPAFREDAKPKTNNYSMKNSPTSKGGFMYNNIGHKIKFLAQLIAWIGIIGSIIHGLVWIVLGIFSGMGGGVVGGFLIGIGVMIGSFLVSWISSWFMYGYGELIEKTTEIARNTTK